MANISVTVNGNNGGNSSGGSTTPPTVPPTTPSSTTPPPPAPVPLGGGSSGGGTSPLAWNSDSSQIVANMRREMASRGVMLIPGTSNYQQLISQLQSQMKTEQGQAIASHFGDVRDDAANAYFDRLEELKNANDLKRQKALAGETDAATIQRINDRYDNLFNAQSQKLKDEYGEESEAINARETAAQVDAERELTRAIQELIQQSRQGNRNSYLTEMRDRYRTAIYNRDNAETAEDVRRYSTEASRIQREMQEAMSGGQSVTERIFGRGGGIFGPITPVFGLGTEWANKALQLYNMPYNTQMSHFQSIGSIMGGDPFGAMLNENALTRQNAQTWGTVAGTAIGAIAGAILAPFTGGLSLAGGIALGGGIGAGLGSAVAGWWTSDTKESDVMASLGQKFQQVEQRIPAYNELSLLSRRPGQELENQRNWLMTEFANGFGIPGVGLDNFDLGLNGADFAKMISSRLKARGIWDNDELANYRRAFMSEGLEKAYSLSSNSIARLSQMDRYGNDANQAVSNLFTTLSNQGTVGMTGGHYLRSDEYLSYLQQIMGSQKGWMNPNANFAVRQLATLQSMFGNDFDERAVNELQQVNGKITNPGGGYASVITNDVIQRLFPETRGNLLAIRQKQYSNNPEDRMRIQQAMFNRLTDMYGGIDTTSGYMALSQYTGIQDPDRLKKWVTQMQNGYVTTDEGNQADVVAQLQKYTPQLTKDTMKAADQTTVEINSKVEQINITSQMIYTFMSSELKNMIKDINEIKTKFQ